MRESSHTKLRRSGILPFGKCFIRCSLERQLKVEGIDAQNEVSASGRLRP